FLEKLMRYHPMPVVMVSALTEAECETTLRALELGAVDFVTKPKLDLTRELPARTQEIVAKVKAAAGARVRPRSASLTARPSVASAPPPIAQSTQQVVAIGASTGGTEALRAILERLPADAPAVLVVQHMPEAFTRAFAERLNGSCAVRVAEAADG